MIPDITDQHIQEAYRLAQERYAMLGVDSNHAIDRLAQIQISLHCWQGDDLGGFETKPSSLGGGLATTGNYPGKARNADELRSDLDRAYGFIAGSHRLNLHSIYAETGGQIVERNELLPEHFSRWIDWARDRRHGIDFNPTCFSHPNAASGFTLASQDEGIRNYWIEHCIACRKIAAHIGQELGTACITNIWIPDGFKDLPVDRKSPRMLLKESLDKILVEKIDPKYNLDAVESKLFGLGSECYVVGSHEFYLGYAIEKGILLCLDSGHFHPTELVSDKLSSVLMFLDQVLLHISRGVRWDSDHVVILSDEVEGITQEIIRGDYLDRVHIGLDYFDASIHRVAAWVIGVRSLQKALLLALLEPIERMRTLELSGDYTMRLALLEQLKSLPFGAVWDYFCVTNGVPLDAHVMKEIEEYKTRVTSKRV